MGDRQAAVPDGKGAITFEGWLQYGTDLLPTLYQEVLAGNVQKFSTSSKDTNINVELSAGTSTLKKPSSFQQPSFFKFQKQPSDIWLGQTGQ